jgi:2-methylcitrate dehydratase PrpD
MPEQSITQVLARLAIETAFGSIPPAVVERAKVSILHNLAVGLAGRPREMVAYVAAQKYYPAPAEATLLHNGARVSCEAAAFANAALMNARSQDDTHAGSTSHPGSPTLGAALAVAESEGASGAEFLAAVILGYEVLCRIGRDFDDQFTARGFRAAALVGGFGAAAAAARLLGLSAGQAAHALGLQANFAGGLARVWREGSGEATMQIGFGARNGIAAARAAACGATAAVYALEGQGGFYHAFAGATAAPREALDRLGEVWQFDEITVKPQPICAILQGPAALFLDLLSPSGIRPDDIAGVTVTLNPYEADYPGIDNAGPFVSPVATKLSAQFCIALAAIERRITPDGLGRLADPEILALAARVTVIRDPAIPPRQCRLAIQPHHGHAITGTVDTPVGQPSFDECGRFALNLAPEIGANGAAMNRLIDAIGGLATASGIGPLIDAAVGCLPRG